MNKKICYPCSSHGFRGLFFSLGFFFNHHCTILLFFFSFFPPKRFVSVRFISVVTIFFYISSSPISSSFLSLCLCRTLLYIYESFFFSLTQLDIFMRFFLCPASFFMVCVYQNFDINSVQLKARLSVIVVPLPL